MNAVLEAIEQDLRYTIRTMRKNLAFAVTAVLTLTLGIGANTAMFTVVRAVLLKPLAYHDPDRLVRVSIQNPQQPNQDCCLTLIRFEEMKAAHSFAGLGAFFLIAEDLTISGAAGPEAVKVARVSANFLQILGVAPVLGRSFLAEEDTPGGRPVTMISAELWQRRFGGDPLILGKTVSLDSTPYSIVGVLPPGFKFPFAVDLWITRPAEFTAIPPRGWPITPVLIGFGRLQPHVSLDQARAELNVLSRQYALAHSALRRSDPSADPATTMRMIEWKDSVVSNVRVMLWTLFGSVGFVLLIACANVASLLLARATGRSREFAVRAALGAARGRLISQLLAESILLASAGGVLGAVLAKWVLAAIVRSSAFHLPRSSEIHLDTVVLTFTVALSIVTGVLFGLFPALGASRPDLADALRASGEGANHGAVRDRALGLSARGLLVVGQVALSMILLIGAGLLLEVSPDSKESIPDFGRRTSLPCI
jgi:putative ABC transport system permease protein